MDEIAVARNVFCAALELVIDLNVYRGGVGLWSMLHTLSDVYTTYALRPWKRLTLARSIGNRFAFRILRNSLVVVATR